MEISGKRKREEDNQNESEELDIEKFSEIVEKFRVPYNWFRAQISTPSASTAQNGDDRKEKLKKIIVEDDPKAGGDGDVWMPRFLLEGFEEEEVIKSWKARPVRSLEKAASAVEFERIDGEEKSNNKEELDLGLYL